MVWQTAAAILARPWPISSWFSSHLVAVLIAAIFALDMASMKLITATTNDAGSSFTQVSQSNPGTVNPGRPRGISPTTLPPVSA